MLLLLLLLLFCGVKVFIAKFQKILKLSSYEKKGVVVVRREAAFVVERVDVVVAVTNTVPIEIEKK